MNDQDTWYLVHSVLKHHDVVKEGNYDDVREALIKLQKEDAQKAAQYYMTQHMPEQEEGDDFSPLEF
jgi:hypothetical protein